MQYKGYKILSDENGACEFSTPKGNGIIFERANLTVRGNCKKIGIFSGDKKLLSGPTAIAAYIPYEKSM
jgi:hypothetical protein